MDPISSKLSPPLLQVIAELGFTRLTPIQAKSIPLLLEGKDLIGQSKTGSGKTAAFTLPILETIDLKQKRIQALILCPTRELCTQVAREVRKFGRRHAGLQVLILSGGQPVRPQIQALQKGIHIVVGTPGRVLDHLRRESLDLSRAVWVVLDEADRMLDMGFEKDMQAILKSLPKQRQTVFFSATFPASIQAMSGAYQRDPVRVTIVDTEAAPDIRQIAYETEMADKVNALLAVFEEYNPETALVFCNLKVDVSELASRLADLKVDSACLHGDMEQADRDRVMAKFRNRSTRILIATDVAARGIDVQDLDLVVNFDLPPKSEVYLHRIGRTGRAGKSGLAVSLVTPRERHRLKMIEHAAGGAIERGHWESLRSAGRDAFYRSAEMATLFISGGRKEKVRAGDILGALTGEAGGLKGEEVGKIEIHDRFSYVAVAKSVAKRALQCLQEGRIKGKKFKIRPVR